VRIEKIIVEEEAETCFLKNKNKKKEWDETTSQWILSLKQQSVLYAILVFSTN